MPPRHILRLFPMCLVVLTVACAHLQRRIVAERDKWTNEVVRHIEPMQMTSTAAPMEFTFGYRMTATQTKPDVVKLVVASGPSFWTGETNSAVRWHAMLDGEKFDFGEFAIDNTANFFVGAVTVMSVAVEPSVVERIAASKKVVFHFKNEDETLTLGNLESIRAFVATWKPGHKDWTPPRRF